MTDHFAPPAPEAHNRAKPKLCRAEQNGHDCAKPHRCILYAGHAEDVPHRADHCGHRWTDAEAVIEPPRECCYCLDEVQTLSSDGLCDACVADGVQTCPNCGQQVEAENMREWPNLNPPVRMCTSCEHNARRSGWEPGQ